MSLFNELKRRNVFRVGAAYALAAWVLLQVVDFVLDAISAPNWILQVFILAAAVGLPVVLIFAWVFEMTPEGIKRESEIDRSQSITPDTGRKLDRVIIGFLAVAVVLLLADRFTGFSQKQGAEPAAAKQDAAAEPPAPPQSGSVVASAKSIAVLPFLALSSGPDDEYFADGLTEEILNALAQLPELLVTARTSSFHFKGQDIPIQEIATSLGVSAVVEGSVRRAGERLRVTAQLIRSADGFHLWSENYDSTSADTIAVQENIAEKIATAMNVVMDESKREAMRRAGLRDVEAFIAMQKGLELSDRAHGDPDMIDLLRQANVYFERVIERVPTYTNAYLQHSDLFIHQLMNGATGEGEGVTEAQEVREAMARARADFDAIIRHAGSPEERNNAEWDLAFVNGDWQGMPARIERFARERGCNEPNWWSNVVLPFGYADGVISRTQEFVACDPLLSTAWRGTARTQLFSGDPEGALQTAQKGTEKAPGEWLSMQLIYALVALGRFDEAEAVSSERLGFDFDKRTSRMLIAAARGDRVSLEELSAQFGQEAPEDDFWGISYNAWAGNRDQANLKAELIDRRAFGSQGLITVLLWCQCGAPWDLSATPNFAANIRKSGLAWPPVSTIRFPLKDW